MSFKTAPVHQGYIEPQACLARFDADGQAELWCVEPGSLRGARLYRAAARHEYRRPARASGRDRRRLRRQDRRSMSSRWRSVLSRKTGHPVKIVMSREDVFKATGPTSGASMTVKIGVKKDGKIVAADGLFKYQAGAFPGSPVMNACMCGFAPYDIANVRSVGYDVVCNRPKIGGLSRARLADLGIRGGERASTWSRAEDRHGSAAVQAEERRQARERRRSGGRSMRTTATPKPSRRCCAHPGYKAPLGKNQGRGVASGLLVQRRRRIERDRARQRGRHGRRRDRQPGHRRLARVDGDDGGRDAGHRLRQGPADRRRHRLDRLHARAPAARASPSRPASPWSTRARR